MHMPIGEHSRINPRVLRDGRVNEILHQQARLLIVVHPLITVVHPPLPV